MVRCEIRSVLSISALAEFADMFEVQVTCRGRMDRVWLFVMLFLMKWIKVFHNKLV